MLVVGKSEKYASVSHKYFSLFITRNLKLNLWIAKIFMSEEAILIQLMSMKKLFWFQYLIAHNSFNT